MSARRQSQGQRTSVGYLQRCSARIFRYSPVKHTILFNEYNYLVMKVHYVSQYGSVSDCLFPLFPEFGNNTFYGTMDPPGYPYSDWLDTVRGQGQRNHGARSWFAFNGASKYCVISAPTTQCNLIIPLYLRLFIVIVFSICCIWIVLKYFKINIFLIT